MIECQRVRLFMFGQSYYIYRIKLHVWTTLHELGSHHFNYDVDHSLHYLTFVKVGDYMVHHNVPDIYTFTDKKPKKGSHSKGTKNLVIFLVKQFNVLKYLDRLLGQGNKGMHLDG